MWDSLNSFHILTSSLMLPARRFNHLLLYMNKKCHYLGKNSKKRKDYIKWKFTFSYKCNHLYLLHLAVDLIYLFEKVVIGLLAMCVEFNLTKIVVLYYFLTCV